MKTTFRVFLDITSLQEIELNTRAWKFPRVKGPIQKSALFRGPVRWESTSQVRDHYLRAFQNFNNPMLSFYFFCCRCIGWALLQLYSRRHGGPFWRGWHLAPLLGKRRRRNNQRSARDEWSEDPGGWICSLQSRRLLGPRSPVPMSVCTRSPE